MTRKWVTYADIMADYMGLKSANELQYNLSNCDQYGELRKAFRDVRNAIKLKLGEDCIETKGNNRSKSFRYIGKDDDPLADMRNAKVITSLKLYWQFCQDSAGFFPTSWIEHFFKDCRDLLNIKSRRQKGEQILTSSLDRILTNIELLPYLYESIRKKQVLSILYKPYEEEYQKLIFHPHLLKEHNGRWFLLGHVEGKEPEFGYNIALDRISKLEEKKGHTYIPAPKGFYTSFFKNIVGVSHVKDAKPATIVIRALNQSMYKLTETKPIHHSQHTIKTFGQHDDGEYGEFELFVEVNNEFIGRILHMGNGLQIVSPPHIREDIKQRISAMYDLYK